MRIAVVHTAGSPCGCAKALAKGLHALGHKAVCVDSAEIALRAEATSAGHDLVIDHTDTFQGTGLLRPFVRGLLESHGARIVGSGAMACLRADNKVAAKTCLLHAGIPVPPGICVTSKEQVLPEWLQAPAVLKPAFEHMSRGIHVASTKKEVREAVVELIDRFRQPLLVEAFIPGRELAVSLLEEESGPYVLPPLEWLIQAEDRGVLTQAFKQLDVVSERTDAVRAELSPDLAADLKSLSVRAFRALGLRDYARFDVRLSEGGAFYFLEANTTPSLELHEALALSARWAGLAYPDLVQRMLSAALRRYGCSRSPKADKMSILLPTGAVDLHVPEGVHRPPPSSLELAARLDVRKGDRVLDLGCGTGLLSIAAARLGAEHVVAADVDSRALEATEKNAIANNVFDIIEIKAGYWFEALNGRPAVDGGRFDVIVATPPQTPGHYAFGPRYGGSDGTRHLFEILRGAASFLRSGSGRLWLMAVSLANPDALLRELRERFHHVCIVHETERYFTGDEYDSMGMGLMDHLLKIRKAGRCEFDDAGEGGYRFKNLIICARGVKEH